MIDKDQARYVMFPICLVQKLFAEPKKTIDDIIMIGIYNYARTIIPQIQAGQAGSQALYDFYHNNLPDSLKTEFERLNMPICDYNGFVPNKGKQVFAPDEELLELGRHWENNIILKKLCFENYSLHVAEQFFKHKLKDSQLNRQSILELGLAVDAQTKGQPMAMCSLDILLQFRDQHKSKEQLIELAAYVAIRSIIGKSRYVRTNKAHIIARMMGYSSVNKIPTDLPKTLKEMHTKYSIRHHMDVLLKKLKNNWYVSIAWKRGLHGFFICTESKYYPEMLGALYELSKDGKDEKTLKREIAEIEKILLQLNKKLTKIATSTQQPRSNNIRATSTTSLQHLKQGI